MAKSRRGIPSAAVALSLEPRILAALRLHEYLATHHWNGSCLSGPDVGIRFNSRIGRFIKSYLRRFHWRDDYAYIQGQGYWVLGNWRLFSILGGEPFRDLAVRCSEYMLERQRPDGAWDYPNPEWRGRIATAEGTWGSLGLLETYRQTGEARFLESVLRWRRFLVQEIGFQEVGQELAVNYFHGRTGLRVPNNSAIVLRFLAELAEAADEETDWRLCTGLVKFLWAAQVETGEFPYTLPGAARGGQAHFQCYQYNAFMCLDLMRYFDLTEDDRVAPVIRRLLRFLRRGQAPDGHSYFACDNQYQEVSYHTAVLAHTFARARHAGIAGYDVPAERAFRYLIQQQRQDGSLAFSRGDYFVLSDQRSYPRNLAMILFHLLPETEVELDSPALAHVN